MYPKPGTGQLIKRILIVSPHFPPVDKVDMHRVRTSLPYFREYGWEPYILTVSPEYVESLTEPLYEKQLEHFKNIYRTSAISKKLCRLFRFGNLALRALPFLYRSGCQIISSKNIDLVYFSTTEFLSMILGPIWKKKFNIPYVIDMQDPWVSDDNRQLQGVKHSIMRFIHKKAEPCVMHSVAGLVSVSPGYIKTLHQRYPHLQAKPSHVLPFGIEENDFDIARDHISECPVTMNPDTLNGVYAGRGGIIMERSLRLIFSAFKIGLQRDPGLFNKIHLYFIGTSYSDINTDNEIKTLATGFGLADFVTEFPKRISYFKALRQLDYASFLIIPGSDDKQYTASKIMPYIFAGKPLLAVFHEDSSVHEILNATTTWGSSVKLNSTRTDNEIIEEIYHTWISVLNRYEGKLLDYSPYTAREASRLQCSLFDQAING